MSDMSMNDLNDLLTEFATMTPEERNRFRSILPRKDLEKVMTGAKNLLARDDITPEIRSILEAQVELLSPLMEDD